MELDHEKIRKLFEKYDKNKNDTLEKKEFVVGFKEMLSQIGENMPEKKHEQVAMEGIKEFDLNGNGCLEYEEFEKLVEFLVIDDFNQVNETIRVEKEIQRQNHLHRPFQEPLGPEPKLQIANLATHYVYPRDIRKKANAIRKANFLCEISNNHPLFKSRTTHQNYVEGHHLIPLKQWDNFLFSLDVEANIVVLCPHCHKMLHHGTKEDIRPLLDLLFQKRKQALADKGIQLTWEQLCSYYGANE